MLGGCSRQCLMGEGGEREDNLGGWGEEQGGEVALVAGGLVVEGGSERV